MTTSTDCLVPNELGEEDAGIYDVPLDAQTDLSQVSMAGKEKK